VYCFVFPQWLATLTNITTWPLYSDSFFSSPSIVFIEKSRGLACLSPSALAGGDWLGSLTTSFAVARRAKYDTPTVSTNTAPSSNRERVCMMTSGSLVSSRIERSDST
jgi:hypothetical protein